MVTHDGAFAGVVADPLAGRSAKPRTTGHTMIIDKGLGLSQTDDLLELAAPYIDFIKFGFGTAALYPDGLLQAKIERIRSFGVEAFPGGTFLEIAWVQGRLLRYLETCRRVGFRLVEVSDGTITLPPADREATIRTACDMGLAVITEVGKKEGGLELDPVEALHQIEADLEAGADKVILEGRESGRGAGLYDPQGHFRQDELAVLVAGVADPGSIMWEAPLKEQQQELIGRLGPDVNLGNIAPGDILALEALRRGLRGDTLRLALAPTLLGGES